MAAVTGEAAELFRRLTEANGPLMFHRSGGCCDGSAPMCYPDGDFLLGDADLHIGDLDIGLDRPVPVHMSKSQYTYWSHTHLTRHCCIEAKQRNSADSGPAMDGRLCDQASSW